MTVAPAPRAALASVLLFAACGDDSAAPDDAMEGGGSGSTANPRDDDSGTSAASSWVSGTGGEEGSEGGSGGQGGESGTPPPVESPCAVEDGQCIFRHDPFGGEVFWTDELRFDEMLEQLPLRKAFALGLKLDVDAVPADYVVQLDLDDPFNMLRLLEHDAVIGLRATVEGSNITSVGITCALCHSTIHDPEALNVGPRLDGWPNRELDIGVLLASMPGLRDYADARGVELETLQHAYTSWGPGRYDARFNYDLINAPVMIPPAYGLRDVALATYTGDGGVSYWNSYEAVTQMGGQGTFVDPALGLDFTHVPDLVMPKLPALRTYLDSLEPPPAPVEIYDPVAAARGEELFFGVAQCGTCHTGATFTDAPLLHDPAALGIEETAAARSKSGRYRTTPLRGAWHRAPFFHDGSAANFGEVINHYEEVFGIDLDAAQRADLISYLRSL